MCGRFTLRTNLSDWIVTLFDEPVADVPATTVSRYNVAPTQSIWCVVRDENHRLRCLQAVWGLLPAWLKSKGEGAKLINARSETVMEKPTFRKLIQTHRCLVPADGYYEWQNLGQGQKQPYWLSRRDEAPFFFAGIWQMNDTFAPDPEHPIASVSILTTPANETFRGLHDRMPLMLFTREERARWMDEQKFEASELSKIAKPPDAIVLQATPVSNRVGNVRQQGADLISPLPL